MFTGPVHRKLHHRLITEKSRDKLFAVLHYFLRKSGKHAHPFLPDLPSRHIQQSFSMFSACKTFSKFNSKFKCNVLILHYTVDPKLLFKRRITSYQRFNFVFSFLQCVLFYLPDVANIRHAYRNLSYCKYG